MLACVALLATEQILLMSPALWLQLKLSSVDVQAARKTDTVMAFWVCLFAAFFSFCSLPHMLIPCITSCRVCTWQNLTNKQDGGGDGLCGDLSFSPPSEACKSDDAHGAVMGMFRIPLPFLTFALALANRVSSLNWVQSFHT